MNQGHLIEYSVSQYLDQVYHPRNETFSPKYDHLTLKDGKK